MNGRSGRFSSMGENQVGPISTYSYGWGYIYMNEWVDARADGMNRSRTVKRNGLTQLGIALSFQPFTHFHNWSAFILLQMQYIPEDKINIELLTAFN